MAFNFSPKIVTDGLVLYLDAANARSYVSGSTAWTDLSRGGNNGRLENGPIYNSANGGSIVFDGGDDYVNIGTQSLGITRDFTISFWANITKNGVVEIFNKGYNPPDYGIYLAKLVSNKLSLQSFSPIINFETTSTITSGIRNYTAVRSNTNCFWYINGVQDNSAVIASTSINQSNLKEWRIGSNFDTVRPTFGGNIYSFSVYNKGLTQTEVLQNYNATKTRFGL
jgi:hypothetical protein